MDKAKVLKTCLSIGAALLVGVGNLITNKIADDKMKETVADEVKKAIENQVKES